MSKLWRGLTWQGVELPRHLAYRFTTHDCLVDEFAISSLTNTAQASQARLLCGIGREWRLIRLSTMGK